MVPRLPKEFNATFHASWSHRGSSYVFGRSTLHGIISHIDARRSIAYMSTTRDTHTKPPAEQQTRRTRASGRSVRSAQPPSPRDEGGRRIRNTDTVDPDPVPFENQPLNPTRGAPATEPTFPLPAAFEDLRTNTAKNRITRLKQRLDQIAGTLETVTEKAHALEESHSANDQAFRQEIDNQIDALANRIEINDKQICELEAAQVTLGTQATRLRDLKRANARMRNAVLESTRRAERAEAEL